MSEILFSIITPVFNRADCIARCLESVVKQNYSSVEMLIVDDGSSDETAAIIESFTKEYDFMTLHRFSTNKGVNAARNWGIQNSRGQYILFLDSDDHFVDNALCGIEKYVSQKPDYNHYLFMQDDRLEGYKKYGLLKPEEDVIISYPDFLLRNVYGDFSHVVKSEVFKKYLFDDSLRIYEELNFLRLYKENKRMLFCPFTVEVIERGRVDSVSNNYKLRSTQAIRQKFSMFKQLMNIFDKDYFQYDITGEKSIPMAKEAYLLGLASSNYDLDFVECFLNSWNKKIPLLYKIIRTLRLGLLLRYFIIFYSNINALIKK